jgi:hypothetical protein
VNGKGAVFAHESDGFVEESDALLVCVHGRDKVAFPVHFDSLCGETESIIECLAESPAGGDGGGFRGSLYDCDGSGGHLGAAREGWKSPRGVVVVGGGWWVVV